MCVRRGARGVRNGNGFVAEPVVRPRRRRGRARYYRRHVFVGGEIRRVRKITFATLSGTPSARTFTVISRYPVRGGGVETT